VFTSIAFVGASRPPLSRPVGPSTIFCAIPYKTPLGNVNALALAKGVARRGALCVRQRTVVLVKTCLNPGTRTPRGRGLQNILLVQSHSLHASAVRDALIQSVDGAFHVIWLTSCCDALSHLAEKSQQEQVVEPIAAVLLDLSLSDSTGIETFDRLFHAAPQIPILILTAVQDEDIAKLAVQHGAQEYLLKDRLDS
jgi:CheY-like chemotaxis protein